MCTYDGLIEEKNGVSERVERHKDCDLDGARRADATACDGETFAHQQQHQDEQQYADHLKHATYSHNHYTTQRLAPFWL